MFKHLILLLFLFAVACSSQAPNRNSNKADLHLRLGSSHLANGNYPQALQELLIAEKLDPKNPITHNNLGLAYLVRDKYDLAEKHLREALRLAPKYSEARNNLGRVLIEMKNFPAAIKEIKTVIDDLTYAQPEKAWSSLGLAYFEQKEYQSAREAFLKSLSLQKNNCEAQSYYGRSLFEMKQYANAARALDKAISFCKASEFDEPHYYSALAYFRMGETSKAIARFQEISQDYKNGQYGDKAKSMLETIEQQ